MRFHFMRLGPWLTVILILLSSLATQAQAPRCVDVFSAPLRVTADNLQLGIAELARLDMVDSFADMIVVADQILVIEPQNTYALRKKAKALIRLDRLDEALTVTQRSLAIDPMDIRVLHMQAQILMKQNHLEEAYSILSAMMAREPHNAATLGMISHALFRMKRYAEALPLLNARLALSFHFPSQSMVAQTLFKFKRYEEALAMATELLKVEPTNYNLLTVQSQSLVRLGRYKEAYESFDRVLRVDPTNTIYLQGQLFTLYRLGRYEESVPVAQRLLALDPQNVLAWSLKSQALLKLQRYEEALVALDARLALEPDQPMAVAMKVQALLKLARFSEAEGLVGRIEDGFFKSYYSAQILIAQKKYSQAIALLKTLDAGLNVKWLLAQASYLSGDMKSARQNLLYIVQNSKTLQVRVVAALIKIQLSGEQTALDPMLLGLTQQLSQKALQKVLSYKEQLFWDYEPVAQGVEISITNTFWSGLNSTPINGHTFHSTY